MKIKKLKWQEPKEGLYQKYWQSYPLGPGFDLEYEIVVVNGPMLGNGADVHYSSQVFSDYHNLTDDGPWLAPTIESAKFRCQQDFEHRVYHHLGDGMEV